VSFDALNSTKNYEAQPDTPRLMITIIGDDLKSGWSINQVRADKVHDSVRKDGKSYYKCKYPHLPISLDLIKLIKLYQTLSHRDNVCCFFDERLRNQD
jgi:hypothetical protein